MWRIARINMAGCKCLGDMTDRQTGAHETLTICGACARPTGECRWLMYSQPYAGMEYYTTQTSFYEAYIIVRCPRYVELKKQEEE